MRRWDGLVEFGSINVVKTDAHTGKPVEGAEFMLYDEEGQPCGRGTTGEDGTYKFVRLYPGTYKVAEINAADGYVANTTEKTVEVKEERLATDVDMEGNEITGTGTITAAEVQGIIALSGCLVLAVSRRVREF